MTVPVTDKVEHATMHQKTDAVDVPDEPGIVGKTIETVSETLQGAAEGLKHGTRVAFHGICQQASDTADTAVSGKEAVRQRIHEASKAPTPSDPSLADKVKEKLHSPSDDEASLQQRQALHNAFHDKAEPKTMERAKEGVRTRLHEMTDEPAAPNNPSIADQIKEAVQSAE